MFIFIPKSKYLAKFSFSVFIDDACGWPMFVLNYNVCLISEGLDFLPGLNGMVQNSNYECLLRRPKHLLPFYLLYELCYFPCIYM